MGSGRVNGSGSELIGLRIAAGQVIDEWLVGKWRSSELNRQRGCGELLALRMNAGSEPLKNLHEFPAFHLSIYVMNLRGKGGPDLGGEHIAQSVTGKVSEGTSGPVHIL